MAGVFVSKKIKYRKLCKEFRIPEEKCDLKLFLTGRYCKP